MTHTCFVVVAPSRPQSSTDLSTRDRPTQGGELSNLNLTSCVGTNLITHRCGGAMPNSVVDSVSIFFLFSRNFGVCSRRFIDAPGGVSREVYRGQSQISAGDVLKLAEGRAFFWFVF